MNVSQTNLANSRFITDLTLSRSVLGTYFSIIQFFMEGLVLLPPDLLMLVVVVQEKLESKEPVPS